MLKMVRDYMNQKFDYQIQSTLGGIEIVKSSKHDQWDNVTNPKVIEIKAANTDAAVKTQTLDAGTYGDGTKIRYQNSKLQASELTLTGAIALTQEGVRFLNRRGNLVRITSKSEFENHLTSIMNMIKAQLQTAISA